MKRSICKLVLTHPSNWVGEYGPSRTKPGDRVLALEDLIRRSGYGGDTTVVCTLESVEDVPVPAAKDQLRRSPGDLNYICLGTTDDFVWIRPQFDDHRTAHMTMDRARFETWELLR